MSIVLKLESKKYCCTLELKEKITFIRGDSGKGKTELVRRLNSGSRFNKVSVSKNYDVIVLTKQLFEQSYKIALNHKKDQNQKENSFLRDYWGEQENFPYSNTILIIDDDDFIKSREFSIFYEVDKSNYYVIMNRGEIASLSYSADEIYKFVSDGNNHWLEKFYHYAQNNDYKIDTVIVEGIGSDYIFFSHLFKEIEVLNPTSNGMMQGGGRANLVSMLEKYWKNFVNKRILLCIDFCAFGSNINKLYGICEAFNLNIVFNKNYLSFEYLLLRSNFINDIALDDFIDRHRLEFHSLELLFTQRLMELTKATYYSYSKSKDSFSVCYYEDCCALRAKASDCVIRYSKIGRNKLFEMLNNTEFDYLLLCSGSK